MRGREICHFRKYPDSGRILDDFSSSATIVSYIISAPNDFVFEPGSGTITAVGKRISLLNIQVSANEVTVNYKLNQTKNSLDGFIISDLKIMALNPGASGELRRTGGTATQVGNPGNGSSILNHGTLASYNYPISVADAGSNTTIQLGGSTIIGGAPTASGLSLTYDYDWSPSSGLDDSNIANPTASPTETTTYTVTITDTNGCSDMAEVTVTVDVNIPPGPDIDISGPVVFCSGGSVLLSSSELSGNQWYKDGNLIVGANDIELLVENSGSYQVSYTNGIIESELSEPVVVEVLETPSDKEIHIQDVFLCAGGSTFVEVLSSEAAVDYTLTNGIENIGIAKSGNGSSIFLPTGSLSAGDYTFYVQAVNRTTLCDMDIKKSVQLTVLPVVQTPAITVSPSNATCGASSITLTADPGFDQYSWYRNNLFLLSSEENVLTLNNAAESGLYKVKGLMIDPIQCESTFSEEIDIRLQPLPLQKNIAAERQIICKGSTNIIIITDSELGILYRIRNNNNNSFVGSSVGGTGGTIYLPLGIMEASGIFNVLATNGNTSCSVQLNDLISINVSQPIIAEATTETQEICFNGADVIILKSSATGGEGELTYNWSGPEGFSSNLENPIPFLPLSTGNHQYKVLITDEIGCEASATINVLVNSIPLTYLSNNTANNVICYEDPIRFQAFGATLYEFYVDGDLVREQDSNNTFETSSLLNNQKVIVIGYNNKGCSSESDEQLFTVNSIPPSYFSGLNDEYCINDASIPLTGIPSGGIFSGNGIRGAEFIPEFAGIGSHLIKYTVVSTAGCDSTYSVSVKVKGSPQVGFTFNNVCDGVAMAFMDSSSPATEIVSWVWDFGDGSNLVSVRNPTHLFPAAGKYNVTLNVNSASGCSNTITKQVIVGAIPQPIFTFQQICEGTSTIFVNQSGSGIISYSWNFGDPASGNSNISTLKDPEHIFSGVGAYNVSLTVANDLCTEVITKTINILPSIGAFQFPYHQDFENDNGGWVSGGQNSSWIYGNPSGQIINKAGSGSSAWSTQANGNTYFDNEQSFVLSPCFDFSGLIRPMISLQIWSHTDKAIDGAVLQYSLNNGATWSRLGNIGEGLEWYNQGSVISQPGGYSIGQEGRSGKDADWRTARFNLDFLRNESSVRFRIAFGSVAFNGNRGSSEGFAFDNIWIGERKKLVVMEHFTNASKSENEEADNYVNILTADNAIDVISLHYHTDRPQVTALNLDNTADPSARSQYYGISQTPRAVLDGNFFNGKSTDWNQNHLKYRSLVEPLFDIDINLPNTSIDQVEVNAVISALSPFNDEIVVHIAVVEEEFFMNNGKIYKNVVKKLLPDGAGTSIMETWQKGSSKSIHVNWNVSKMYGEGRPLKVIVYVQNNNTKEILQSKYVYSTAKRNSIPTSIQDDYKTLLPQKIQVFPVPSSKEVNCVFSTPLEQDYFWKVIDLRGIIMKKGSLVSGTSELVIDTSVFPEGIYFLQLASDHNDYAVRKIIIKH
ncbi:MAG: PKD domain-containing protein [Bacteroidota bacterium]|nr:PKD domain-containing protein [Bacteroidota bacterium]